MQNNRVDVGNQLVTTILVKYLVCVTTCLVSKINGSDNYFRHSPSDEYFGHRHSPSDDYFGHNPSDYYFRHNPSDYFFRHNPSDDFYHHNPSDNLFLLQP